MQITPDPTHVRDNRADWLFVAKHKGQSAMVLGIASLALLIVPFFIGAMLDGPGGTAFGLFVLACFGASLAVGIVGLVLAVKARKIAHTGPAMAGLVCSIVGISLAGLSFFLVLISAINYASTNGY